MAIKDAQEALGITNKELAMAAGASQGTISYALGGKASMSEQKWRMVCEHLGMDYDIIVADPVEAVRPDAVLEEHAKEEDMQVQVSGEHTATAAKSVQDDAAKCRNDVLARYLAKNLKRDLEQGTDMGLEELWVLLDCMRHMQKDGAC